MTISLVLGLAVWNEFCPLATILATSSQGILPMARASSVMFRDLRTEEPLIVANFFIFLTGGFLLLRLTSLMLNLSS